MLEGQQGKVELILMKMALLSLKVLECQMTLKKIKSHGEMAGMHLDNIQDFLCKLGMKPHMHLVKISIFSLNRVIVRPTKIIKGLCEPST